MNNREFNEIDIVEMFITADSTKLSVLKKQSIENSEKSQQLRKTKSQKK